MHDNAMKPYLLNEDIKARLEFCLSIIDQGTPEFKPLFINIQNQIHIDENCFYISKTSQKYYLHLDKQEPFHT